MNRDPDRHKLFGRRAALLAGGKFVLLSALVGRMYYLQVVESDRYATLAEENRINLRLLAPPRGRIVDRFGVPLADNQQNYRVQLVPEDIKGRDIETVLDLLGSIVPLDQSDRKRILREIRRNQGFVPVTVRENLSWPEVTRIEVNSPDMPGVMIDVGQSRRYLLGTAGAHILGYVGAVSERDMGEDPLLKLPGFRVGKAGVEKVHDQALRGTGGSSQVEVNAYGRMIREISRREGEPGAEVMLSVDAGLQEYVAGRLKSEESAAAVVMDVHTGDVLAMASSPAFEPDAFNQGLSSKDWRDLVGDARAPLINKAIGGQYAPGSTYKMVVLMAALERGVISPEETVFCPGHMTLGDSRFHCWKRWGHGKMKALEAIQQSCDVYFYEVAKRTGIDRIAEMSRRFGLGHETGLDLPGERPGLIPTRDWKRKVLDGPWHQGETLIAGIGQGYVLTTPLQLAVMTARIANGGRMVSPRLTRRVVGDPKLESAQAAAAEPVETLGLSSQHLAIAREGMNMVVNSARGTARRAAIEEKGFEMAGKTGTAQVRRITKAEREKGVLKNEDLEWRQRDHALFVAFAPVESPRYAISVVVEHGGGGSTVAAPIARDILITAQRRNSARPGLLPAAGPKVSETAPTGGDTGSNSGDAAPAAGDGVTRTAAREG